MSGVRVRHELRRRTVQVVAVDDISPRMRRIVVGGPELDGFVSLAADDHVKLFFPERRADRSAPPDPAILFAAPRRDFTPRRYDAASNTLTLEFVLHGDGPAAGWAAGALCGDWLGVAGPRGSLVPPDDDAPCLLVGDETALPAIARRLEEMQPGVSCIALIEVADETEIRHLPTPAHARIDWLTRNGAAAGTTTLLDRALESLTLPGDARIWIAAEIDTARRLRDHLVEARGVDRAAVRAAGYWRLGMAESEERLPA